MMDAHIWLHRRPLAVLSRFQKLSFVLRKGSAPCPGKALYYYCRWKVATLSTRLESPLWSVTPWHTFRYVRLFSIRYEGEVGLCGVL